MTSTISTLALDSYNDIHHLQEQEQTNQGWHQGYYDPTFERTPWANLRKAPGLKPMGFKIRTVPQTPKVASAGITALYQCLKDLSISSKDTPSPLPLKNSNPISFIFRGADEYNNVALSTIPKGDKHLIFPSTTMKTAAVSGRELMPEPFPAPAPEIATVTTVPATTTPTNIEAAITLATSAAAAAATIIIQTGKVARDRRRRQRKREKKRVWKQEEREEAEKRRKKEVKEAAELRKLERKMALKERREIEEDRERETGLREAGRQRKEEEARLAEVERLAGQELLQQQPQAGRNPLKRKRNM